MAKAKKAPVEAKIDSGESELTAGQKMSATLRKYRAGYETVRSASGKKSLDKGDPVAKALRAKTPKQVCELAEQLLHDCNAVTKYAHLNLGQQRMNAGNLIRNAIKRGELKTADVVKAAQ